MNNAQEFYRQGKLTEAVTSLQAHLKEKPADSRARIFLFELLCFTGDFDRARKHLALAPAADDRSRLGVTLYLSALAGETERQAWFRDTAPPEGGATSAGHAAAAVRGSIDGLRFSSLTDADPRIGARLEFIAAGRYHRVAFRDLRKVRIEPPVTIRDLYWRRANIWFAPHFGSESAENVLLPVLYPHSHEVGDDLSRLGRTTEYLESEDGRPLMAGQRLLLADGVEHSFLQAGELEIDGDSDSLG